MVIKRYIWLLGYPALFVANNQNEWKQILQASTRCSYLTGRMLCTCSIWTLTWSPACATLSIAASCSGFNGFTRCLLSHFFSKQYVMQEQRPTVCTCVLCTNNRLLQLLGICWYSSIQTSLHTHKPIVHTHSTSYRRMAAYTATRIFTYATISVWAQLTASRIW
jgi:hypothetical protein